MSEDKGGKLHIDGSYLASAKKHRILSREEEAALAMKIQKGDEAAWEELVLNNLRLVISIARRYVGQGLEFADLIQEGNVGLMRAARSFDTAFGTKFSTYATWCIKTSIGRAISNKASFIRIPTHAAALERVVNGAYDRFQATTGREPSIEELSEVSGKSAQEVTGALAMRKAVVSYDAPFIGAEGGSLSDMLADETKTYTEDMFMENDLKASIQNFLAELPERQRYILERRYGLDGGREATLTELGQEMGVTRQRALQLHNVALSKLRSSALELQNLESLLERS